MKIPLVAQQHLIPRQHPQLKKAFLIPTDLPYSRAYGEFFRGIEKAASAYSEADSMVFRLKSCLVEVDDTPATFEVEFNEEDLPKYRPPFL